MTTIACDGKSMAGDTLVTSGSEIVGYAIKIERTKDGRIFGSAGPGDDCRRFAQWMQGGDKPELSNDFSALILTLDGTVYYVGATLEPSEFIVPQALGSGGDFAIGAMLAGKSPRDAVAIAIERDTRSGGDITVEHLELRMATAA